MDDLISKLKSLKHKGVSPNKEWLKKNRAFLLSQISNTVTSQSKSKFILSSEKMWKFMAVFLPRSVVYGIVRPVAIVAMVIGLGTSGWIATVAASQNTVPGDALHSTKMMTEKVHIAVLSAIDAKDTETIKRGNYAKRRAQEVQKLASSNDVEKINRVPLAIKVLKEEVKEVEEDIKEIKESAEISKKVSAGAIKEVEKDTKEIGSILKDVEKGLVNSTSTTEEARVDLVEAKKVSAETSVKAMEVMVGKHIEGDKTVTIDEVKEMIKEKAKELSNEANNSTNVLNKAKAETKKASDIQVELASTTLLSSISTTTKKENQDIKDVNKKTEDAADEVSEVKTEIDSKVKEAGSLLSKGDFESALKVVVEASKTVAKAQITKDTTINDLQKISPEVVSIVLDVSPVVVAPTNTPLISTSTNKVEINKVVPENSTTR